MSIQANVTGDQITVSVDGDSVTATVSGGIGPSGPAGPAGTLPAGTEGYVLTYVSGSWTAAAPSGAVSSVNGETGVVVLNAADVGAAAASHAHAWSDITSGVPSSFAPSAHAASHAAAGSDAISISSEQVSLGNGAVIDGNAKNFIRHLSEEGGPEPGFARDILGLAQVASTGSYNDLANLPTLFDGSYSSLSSVPSTFTPASHTHGNITSAGAIGSTSGLPIKTGTSGVLEAGAFGTSAGQFAEGNHTHSQLHDRSHAMTDTSDHTATAWRVFYSNSSGNVTELALGNAGQALLSNGASAAPSWGAAGSNSASDLSTGTLSNARLTSRARTAINVYNWSSFR